MKKAKLLENKTSKDNSSKVINSLVWFIQKLDLFDSVKRIQYQSTKFKLLHSLIGFSILLVYQLMPYYGLVFLNKSVTFNLLFTQAQNLTTLPRNALVSSGFLFNVLLMMGLKNTNYNKDKINRGLRNLSILVGLFRSNIILVYRQLGRDAILLFPQDKLFLVVLIYTIQNLVGSYFILGVEQYLQNYGIAGSYLLVYYQAIDLAFQVANNPTPGNLTLLNCLVLFLIYLFGLVVIDRTFEQRWDISPINLAGSALVKPVKYSPFMLLSSATILHSMFKQVVSNFMSLIYNPSLYYISYFFEVELLDYMVDQAFFEHILFTEDYNLIWYFPTRGVTYYIFLGYLGLDTLFYGLIIRNIANLDSQYNATLFYNSLVESRLKVNGPNETYFKISQDFKRLLNNSLVIGLATYFLQAVMPSYGVYLKISHVTYFFGRFTGLIETLKNEDSEVLSYLGVSPKIKKYL